MADLEQAREAAGRDAAGREAVIMVIGGAQIYRECLPFASRIHLTLVHTRIEDGDAFFDAWRGAEWRESSRERHEADEKNSVRLQLHHARQSGQRREPRFDLARRRARSRCPRGSSASRVSSASSRDWTAPRSSAVR